MSDARRAVKYKERSQTDPIVNAVLSGAVRQNIRSKTVRPGELKFEVNGDPCGI